MQRRSSALDCLSHRGVSCVCGGQTRTSEHHTLQQRRKKTTTRPAAQVWARTRQAVAAARLQGGIEGARGGEEGNLEHIKDKELGDGRHQLAVGDKHVDGASACARLLLPLGCAFMRVEAHRHQLLRVG